MDDSEVLKLQLLIQHIAWSVYRRTPPNITMDQLLSAGWLGALKAVRACRNPDTFMQFARRLIHGAILDELRHSPIVGTARKSQNREPRTVALGDWMEAQNLSHSDSKLEYESIRKRAHLSDQQQDVIRQYFFEGKTLVHIGADLHLAQPRIYEIKAAALQKLRDSR